MSGPSQVRRVLPSGVSVRKLNARVCSAWPRISSLEKNPEMGRMPVMAMVATRKVVRVDGRYFRSPPILWMSCSPCSPWMTAPDPRNRHALKKACVTRCMVPAKNAPTPTPMNMNPSCETVEYASTFLMSFCEVAISADQSAVSTPTTATTAITPGAETYRWLRRATMYTPAVTIVAAWISAETGVGPAPFPADERRNQVVAEHQRHHRGDEQVQVREVAPVPGVLLHVPD